MKRSFSIMSGTVQYSALCLLAILPISCADFEQAAEADDGVGISAAVQGIGTEAPKEDPQLCRLPEGRYVVSATATTTPNVYNVMFPNDDVPNSKPSNLCKTMLFVWNEGAVPVPAVAPPDDQLDRMLVEGWMIPTVGSRRFAVKAYWQTHGGLGVITGVSNKSTSAYAVMTCDLATPCNKRFNWIGPGSDVNHSSTMPMSFALPNQSEASNFTIAIDGSKPPGDTLRSLQFLYLRTGSSRIHGEGLVATRPCTTGNVCPQP